jgi:hypothetical protein
VSLMTKQDSEANGSAQQPLPDWARQTGGYLRARQLATQAQLAPLATNARISAQQGMTGARAWTAPRLELMGQALQEQWAPRISAALAAYARRIDPIPPEPPPSSRRRWPAVVGGVVLIVGGAAAAVVILNRRNSAAIEPEEPDETASAPDASQDMAAADTVGVDVNGQTQAPRP